MAYAPPARHLLRARDLADSRYADSLAVEDMARAAGLSRAHFIREFGRAFGESPHAYLLTRRLERVSPLAVPALLEISREMVAGEADEAILRENEDALIRDAMRVD